MRLYNRPKIQEPNVGGVLSHEQDIDIVPIPTMRG